MTLVQQQNQLKFLNYQHHKQLLVVQRSGTKCPISYPVTIKIPIKESRMRLRESQ